VVDLLLLLTIPCMRELLRISLEIAWLALFWVVACFLDQSFWLLQLGISNVLRIITSMLAFQAPHLVYPFLGRHTPHIGRSDLSLKNHSWHSLELLWLIDSSDGLNMMNIHEFFFKSFSFFLFKPFSIYQMISNSY